MLSLSKNSLIVFYLFVIIYFSFRLLLPFGDEPDFIIRAYRLHLTELHFFFSPYKLISEFLNNIDYISFCKITGTNFSLLNSLSSNCSQSLEQVFYRFFLTLYIILPLFIICIVRSVFFPLSLYIFKLDKSELSQRLDIILLTLIFPSVMYNFGIIGYEPFFLMLSMLIFLFIKNNVVIFIILFLLFNIDVGDSLVVLTFISFYKVYSMGFLNGRRWIIFIIISSLSIFINVLFLNYIVSLGFFSNKATSILDKYDSLGNFRDSYPVILRPIITYMSMIFYTPNYLKSISSFFIVSVVILRTICLKKNIYCKLPDIVSIGFFSSVTLVCFFVFMLPDYANAKYYIFTFPFLLSPFYYIYGFKKCLIFILIINVSVQVGIIVDYLNFMVV